MTADRQSAKDGVTNSSHNAVSAARVQDSTHIHNDWRRSRPKHRLHTRSYIQSLARWSHPYANASRERQSECQFRVRVVRLLSRPPSLESLKELIFGSRRSRHGDGVPVIRSRLGCENCPCVYFSWIVLKMWCRLFEIRRC